jgi:hypothetical protein
MKGLYIMHLHHTLQLSRWMRFIALSLLLGFGLMSSMVLSSSKAHAATTLTVSNCSNDSQLQADVNQANVDNAGDIINFSCSGDIKLSQTLTISGSMTIDGSGQSVTLDGQNQMEVLDASSSDLTINALIIADGSVPGNGGSGGGIYNTGTLSITNTTLSDNSVPGAYGTDGGGLENVYGTVSISNSTITNNSANSNDGVGGGIFNDYGTMTISNSTIASNSANAGGGIGNVDSTMSISNSTIASNSASYEGGGIYITNGTVSSDGSMVANNTGGDCENFGSIQDNGYNLDSDSSCFTAPTSLHTNPQLAALANNGGPTQTMALQPGSPAIDQIPVANCPTTDQRGDPRPDNGETACDVGAYEFSDPVDNDLRLTNMPSNITTNATSPQGSVVTYTPPTVVDEDNPLPPVNCSPASGSVFPIGTTNVMCSVSDSDDSNSPVSQGFSVTVNGAATQVSELISLVNSFHLSPGGIQTSFDSQLQAVQTDLTNNNTAQACSDLTSFISHAQAQSGKHLSVSQADQMIAAAQQIQAVLGC